MTTASVQEFSQDLAGWLQAAGRGEVVCIVNNGREMARLVPPQSTGDRWANRFAELEAIFPEPIAGASEAFEEMLSDRL